MNYKRALVVEDNSDLRLFFCRALNLEKIETHGFGSVQEALDYLGVCSHGNLPDLAVVDFSLGEKSGAELIREIRSRQRTAAMTVVMISGWQEVGARALELGADAFLRKPFDFDDFCQLLRTLAKRHIEVQHSSNV